MLQIFQPLHKHLLTVGVHTCICHSQHEKRPDIKGLSLCLGPAFGIFLLSSPSVDCFTPKWTFLAWTHLNSATLSFTSLLWRHKLAPTPQNNTSQRKAIFTAAIIDMSAKVLHMNGLTAVCPAVMTIWVYTNWSAHTSRSQSILILSQMQSTHTNNSQIVTLVLGGYLINFNKTTFNLNSIQLLPVNTQHVLHVNLFVLINSTLCTFFQSQLRNLLFHQPPGWPCSHKWALYLEAAFFIHFSWFMLGKSLCEHVVWAFSSCFFCYFFFKISCSFLWVGDTCHMLAVGVHGFLSSINFFNKN